MKVPFTAPKTHQSSNPKPPSFNSTTLRSTHPHEPKSVLDLRRSSSPVSDKPAKVPASSDVVLSYSDDSSLQWVEHFLNNTDDWNSLLNDVGSIPQFTHSDSQIPVFSEFQSSDSFDLTQFNDDDYHHMDQWNCGSDFVGDIVRASVCIESNDPQLAHLILARLNQQLGGSATGKPLRRAAFYFAEALQSLLTGSTHPTRPSSSSEVVQTIKAHKTFSNVSPITMFSNFTANQAILEAVNGSMLVHVVDFDIGLGGHWASFMKVLADQTSPPILRITAVVPEEYAIESRLVRDNLGQFARELRIGFDIEFVSIRTFEFLSFKAIRFMGGEKTAVVLSPTILRIVGAGILTDLRRIAPHVVVYVDSEGSMDGSSFRDSVINGLEFYSTVLDSLGGGGGDDWVRRIDTFLVRPKIFAAVEAAAAGRNAMPWREVFTGAGMRPVVLGRCAEFQAEGLLRRVQVNGFHVAKREAELVLCWHDRALVATSAWRW
ncbi:scarecrow-like protein 15 [Cornus florida]|uniref:scarecrow-like protein 15 n=1 Tax=Cornus florida TaxID=4283 RepID=UPI00289A81B0|nr:scarecrow-like protein 15 [Cornus florida]